MTRDSKLAAVWIVVAAIFGAMQYPLNEMTSMLIAGASGAILTAYIALFVYRSPDRSTYLKRGLPLLAVVCACVYCVLTGVSFYGLDQAFKGFLGFGAGMFVMAAVAKVWR